MTRSILLSLPPTTRVATTYPALYHSRPPHVLPYGYLFFFFFFQAEDGIRDLTVTGVQTCALPISRPARRRGPGAPGHGGVQSPCGLHESRGLRARAARDAPGEWAALVAPDHADRKSVV